MAKERKKPRQVKEYDKIFKENIAGSLSGIMKHLLGIEATQTEDLPNSIQHTKEREPDVLKIITDSQGRRFVLQLEFQLENEPEMVYRMADYCIMLHRKYKMEVRQYVVYIGEGDANMPTELSEEHYLWFQYSLISLSSINYHVFLESESPEEKMLALLANFGTEEPKSVVYNIIDEVIASSKGPLDRQRYIQQMHILGKLRKLVSVNSMIMESITDYLLKNVDLKSDVIYQMGEKEGKIEGKIESQFEVVKNLLTANRFTTSEIANFAGVTEDFVEEIKASVK